MIQYRPEPQAVSLHQLHHQLCQNLAEDQEVDAFETATDGRSAVSELAAQLVSLTRRLFPPGPLEVSLQADPDDERLEYLIFTVAAEGEFPAIRDRQSRWHDEVESLVVPGEINIRLSVYPR